MKKNLFLITAQIFIAITLFIPSISFAKNSGTNLPKLEVEQVMHRWEIIIRVYDWQEKEKKEVICNIFKEHRNSNGLKVEKISELELKKIEVSQAEFIGIYSNGKILPHGTKIVVKYGSPEQSRMVEASTKMYYH